MKCEKCGNEYQTLYEFATPTICRYCYASMTEAEKEALKPSLINYTQPNQFELRAGFGLRLAATLIDQIILIAIVVVLFYFSGFFRSIGDMINTIKDNPGSKDMIIQLQKEFMVENKVSFIFSQLIPLVYYSLELFAAASLGKIILGLRIGNEDKTVSNMTSLLTRYLTKNSAGIVMLLFYMTQLSILNTLGSLIWLSLLVGYFFILALKRQGFHDMMSKTAIFKSKDLVEGQG